MCKPPPLKAFVVRTSPVLPTSQIWLQAEAKVAELRACKARHESSRQAVLQPWDCHFYAVRLKVSYSYAVRLKVGW